MKSREENFWLKISIAKRHPSFTAKRNHIASSNAAQSRRKYVYKS